MSVDRFGLLCVEFQMTKFYKSQFFFSSLLAMFIVWIVGQVIDNVIRVEDEPGTFLGQLGTFGVAVLVSVAVFNFLGSRFHARSEKMNNFAAEMPIMAVPLSAVVVGIVFVALLCVGSESEHVMTIIYGGLGLIGVFVLAASFLRGMVDEYRHTESLRARERQG